MNGRVHYYEGYDMHQVVLPVCTMARLGVKKILLTNAAGSLNRSITPGSLVCIKDQISSFVPSPLVGKNDDELGDRFFDMSEVYDRDLRQSLHETADKLDISLVDGVYLQVTGPAFETPSEARLYASLGTDTVGMSTAVEATALHHMGVRVVELSFVTNLATLDESTPTSQEEIEGEAQGGNEPFVRLVETFVPKMAQAN